MESRTSKFSTNREIRFRGAKNSVLRTAGDWSLPFLNYGIENFQVLDES